MIKTETKTYKIGTVFLTNTRDRGWIADIMFEILDDNQVVAGTTVVSKTGLDYNAFWNSFNSGEYLYQLLIEQESLNTSIPEGLEETFVNPD